MSLIFVDLSGDHVADAAALLALRHREDRRAAPILPARYEDPAEVAPVLHALLASEGMHGVAALQGGQLLGFLCGSPVLRPPDYLFAGFVQPRSGDIPDAGYALAPGGITNAAIEDATATVNEPDQDGNREDDYGVNLILTFDGIDTFNELASACKHRESPCDAGLAAIALDQVVLMAPRVADEEFSRFDIQISGDIDEETANSMVAALTTAPLPRGLEFSE